MLQIFMSPDKSLTTTNSIRIYQREKLVDKVQFIFPQMYEEFDLREFTPCLIYTNSIGEIRTELLTISNEEYKENYFTCVLPVDTNITKYAGDVILHLQLTKYDAETGQQYALTTGEDKITISTVQDVFEFVPDSSLDIITQKIGELDAQAKALAIISQEYAENKVDDVEIDNETDTLYVTASGVRKGKGVQVIHNGDDGSDGAVDGVIDIDALPDPIEI